MDPYKGVTILKFLYPFPVRAKSVDIQTRNLLHLLIADEYFQTKIKIIRSKYGIPEKGYEYGDLVKSKDIEHAALKELSIEENEELFLLLHKYSEAEDYRQKDKVEEINIKLINFLKNLGESRFNNIIEYLSKKDKTNSIDFPLLNLEKDMEKDLIKIKKHFDFPKLYTFNIFLLMTFNSFLKLDLNPNFLFLSDKTQILNELKDKDYKAVILITNKFSKRQLVNWLDKEWVLFENEVNKLPSFDITRSKNLEISETIYKMKESGNTYSKLSEKLGEQFGDDERIYDVGWLKENYSRYKRILEKYGIKRNKKYLK